MHCWRTIPMQILIVDDEPRIRSALEGLLGDEGYFVESRGSGEAGLQALQEKSYDVIFLDVVLPGMDGLETLGKVREFSPSTTILMMSGQADLTTAVRATKMGAHNFFEKPLNPDRVLLELKNISKKRMLERRLDSLESRVDEEDRMIGNSPAMKCLAEGIEKAAPSEGRVFIFGENGTGKELVAREIHRKSRRADRPFVSINCAALPKDLVESELFGYEKGAFTGAARRKPGLFETANGGTLFLDEVGDMALDTQAKLLRVLQENEAIRLGGTSAYKFDVRIISATNKDLQKEIDKHYFREDLFFRLNVIPLEVPPLRDRSSDVEQLASYFLQQICGRTGGGMKRWEPGALKALQSYHWPGNVRELKNLVERLVIMSGGNIIDEKDVAGVLPSTAREDALELELQSTDESTSFRERIEQFEKEILVRGYREAEGNVSKLARNLKIDRANLHRKLKAYGIK